MVNVLTDAAHNSAIFRKLIYFEVFFPALSNAFISLLHCSPLQLLEVIYYLADPLLYFYLHVGFILAVSLTHLLGSSKIIKILAILLTSER